jgi:hypothetical protein
MTSTSGVTLMSDFGPPLVPPMSIAMGNELLANAECQMLNAECCQHSTFSIQHFP